MNAVMEKLVDEEAGIIRLFTPAFANTPKDPGYIKAYPPGIRENGGQYTHAAIWVVLALAELNRGDDAWKAFQLLNPINHALDQAKAEHYRVEPYVVSADIYGVGEHTGRGGWSWYTGSAGWLYRAAVEGILGIRREGNRLFVKPVLPTDWTGFTADLQLDGKTHHIVVEKAAGSSETSVTIDGQAVAKDEGHLIA